MILLKADGYTGFIYLLHSFIPEKYLLKTALFFLITIVSVIVFTLFYLLWKNRLTRRKEIFQKKFKNLISEIAICESEEELNDVLLQPGYQEIFNQYQQTRTDRNFMIEELAETCKRFAGTVTDNIRWLFQKSHLEEELLHHLNSHRWYVKAKAVQQLAYLKQNNHVDKIFALINHKDSLVRMEAQIANIKLIGFDGLKFLNVISYPIPEWQQLRLIHEFSGQAIEKFDPVTDWLRSKNESVVEFALRLVEINQRYEFYTDVESCLTHSSVLICRQAVVTLGKISNEKTAGSLINYYPHADASIQLLILKILQIAGTEKEIPFLLQNLNHPDDTFKLETARAIRQINGAGIEKIEDLVDVAAEPWSIILPQLKMEGSV